MSTSSSESRTAIVLELAEEFLERYRRGERPPLKEYTDRHPELASEIREVFPAMAMMEKIALAEDSLDGDATGDMTAARPPRLSQLGDFRIIREVGHGGMGVVYEAEQVSLGRHVALKVLPAQMVRDPKTRRRFEREAKSAARLHHTNIVPVFGVGEHEGTPYYVMQFIQGLGLDDVIDEIKRIRLGSPDKPATERGPRRDFTAADIARSLVTGRFEPLGSATPPEPGDEPTLAETRDTQVHEQAAVVVSGEPSAGSAKGSPSLSSSSVSILGQNSAAVSGSRRHRRNSYWQGVARIGLQVAEALEYAHKQGILHRDIKPSNLLLDASGTVWVTDFGLAKADDQQNLTHTGDILGTLRYMPHEAFDGKSDVRGDVYSLGLTLYEMLAYRPAFDEKDRGRLIKQVTNEEAPRLGRINAEVPRDLQTIVHKAIERDPSHRYSSAGSFADDLRHFVDDEPIAARRTTTTERFTRWCRRNPYIAGLAASLLVLMAVTTIASMLTAQHMRRLALQESQSAVRADEQRRAAESATRDAEAAKLVADSERKQAETNFAQARAAVDDYLTKVTDSQLLTAPGLQPLRRQLLGSALKFYDEFLQQRRDDPSLRSAQASVHLRVAKIQREVGDEKAEEAEAQEAAALYEALVRDQPDDEDLQLGLIESSFRAGALQRAFDAGERLVRTNPDNRRAKYLLAQAYNQSFKNLYSAADYVNGLEMLQKSLALRESLIQAEPQNPEYENAISGSLNNLALLLQQLGRPSDALPIFRRADFHARSVFQLQPNNYTYGRSAVVSLNNVLTLERQFGLEESANKTNQMGLELSGRLATKNPEVPIFASFRLQFARQLGDALNVKKKRPEAIAAYREALAALESPTLDNPEYWDERALISGALAQLLHEAETSPSESESATPRSIEREQLESLTLRMLERLYEEGLLTNPKFMTQNTSFKGLTERVDFKVLLAKVEQAEKSPLQRPQPKKAVVAARTAGPKEPQTATDEERRLQARGDVAAGHFVQGAILCQFKKWDEARKALGRALEQREALVRDDPKNLRNRFDLGMVHVCLGDMAHQTQHFVQAYREWATGYDMIAGVLDDAEVDDPVAGEAAVRLAFLGEEMTRNGFWEEASLRFKQAYGNKRPLRQWNLGAEGLTYLSRNDRESWRAFCKRDVEDYQSSENGYLLLAVAVKCAVAPESGIDPALVMRMGERGFALVDPDITYTAHPDLAMPYYRTGRFDEALEHLDLFERKMVYGVEADDGYAGFTQALRAMVLHRLGRMQEAKACLSRAQVMQAVLGMRSVSNPLDDTGLWMWGWAMFRILIMEAEALINGVETRENPWNLLLEARATAQYGLRDKARAILDNPLIRDPADPALLAARGQVLQYLGDEAEGRSAMVEALKRDPDNRLALLSQGKWLLAQGKPLEAAETLVRATDQLPTDGDPDGLRVPYDMLLVSSDEAFQHAVELRPNDRELWVAKARSLAWLGKWKEAADAYERGSASGPYANHWVEYGCVLVLAGEHDRYRQLCKRIDFARIKNEVRPTTKQQQLRRLNEVARLALLEPESGIDLQEARRWAVEALSFEGNLSWYRHTAAMFLFQEHEPQQAVNFLTTAIAGDPLWSGNGMLYCALARAYFELGNFEDGKHWFDKAEARMAAWEQEGKSMVDRYPVKYWIIDFLEAQVQRQIARKLLESKTRADQGRQALQEGRPSEAADHLVGALELMPDDRRMEASRFEIDGLLASSDEAFQKAVGLRPNDPQIWVARGRHFAWHGKWKEAAEAYGKGVVSQPVWFDWIEYASVLVLADDLAGYQRLCARMLERVSKPAGFRSVWSEAQARSIAARIARLHPSSGIDPEQILDWADAGALQEPLVATYYSAAAARLRSGHYEEAAALATRSIAEPPGWWANWLNWYVLAMAHQKQSHDDEAHGWLDKAEAGLAEIEREAATKPYPPQGYYLADVLEARVLQREARALLPVESRVNQVRADAPSELNRP